MALWSEVPEEDQAVVLAFMRLLRSGSGELARTNNHLQVAFDMYWGQAKAVIDTLDAGVEIPNQSGLDGAEALTKEEVQDNLMAYITTVLSVNTTAHRQQIGKACGPVNMIG